MDELTKDARLYGAPPFNVADPGSAKLLSVMFDHWELLELGVRPWYTFVYERRNGDKITCIERTTQCGELLRDGAVVRMLANLFKSAEGTLTSQLLAVSVFR